MKYRLLVLILVAGCEVPEDDLGVSSFGTSSRKLAFAPDEQHLVAVDPDERQLVVAHIGNESSFVVGLDGEPGHVAWHGRRLFVSLRDRREVVEFAFEAGMLKLQQRFVVGAEPDGLVIEPRSDVLYVACETARSIVAISIATGEMVGEKTLPFGPRWLGMSGDTLIATGLSKKVAIFDSPDSAPRIINVSRGWGALPRSARGSGPAVAVGPDRVAIPVALARVGDPQRPQTPYYAESQRLGSGLVLLVRDYQDRYVVSAQHRAARRCGWRQRRR